ncbi:hypothetical protein H9N28_11020 [Rhodobacter capsulatus]|uniref:hypothetical protein n=1 Tax=Rhodobacter capsulatus TaxID=1061 RepID=UPI000A56E07C|nr:hypothetical protein [Rhodobacter capsulatus]PZX21386.1 hypothetical protein LY44_03406 [Rhodobacter capsulatus]QNR62126.1 hypothetical protein H9N28_11020 [Rhodobacter capsulatus]
MNTVHYGRPRAAFGIGAKPLEAPWKQLKSGQESGNAATRKKNLFLPNPASTQHLAPWAGHAHISTYRNDSRSSRWRNGLKFLGLIVEYWFEGVTLFLTVLAVLYAHLAYRSSVKSAAQARAAELTSLKIQANTVLDDVYRALLALRSACQANHQEWIRHEGRRPMMLSGPQGMFAEMKSAPIERQGHILWAQLKDVFAKDEAKTPADYEALIKQAREVASQIMGLTAQLESPPAYQGGRN